jgi:hypothetical protein
MSRMGTMSHQRTMSPGLRSGGPAHSVQPILWSILETHGFLSIKLPLEARARTVEM